MLDFYYTLRSRYARKVRILLAEMGTPPRPVAISPGSVESGSLFGGRIRIIGSEHARTRYLSFFVSVQTHMSEANVTAEPIRLYGARQL